MSDVETLCNRLRGGCLHAAFEGSYLCPEAQEIAAALKGLKSELALARAEVHVLRDTVTRANLPKAEALIAAEAERPRAFLTEDVRMVAEDLAHWGEAAASARVAEIAYRLRYRSLESCLND